MRPREFLMKIRFSGSPAEKMSRIMWQYQAQDLVTKTDLFSLFSDGVSQANPRGNLFMFNDWITTVTVTTADNCWTQKSHGYPSCRKMCSDTFLLILGDTFLVDSPDFFLDVPNLICTRKAERVNVTKYLYSSYKVLLFSQNAINLVERQLGVWRGLASRRHQNWPYHSVICNTILDLYEIFICGLLFLICVLGMNYCYLTCVIVLLF